MNHGSVFLFLSEGEVYGMEAADLPSAASAFFDRLGCSGTEAYLGRLKAVLGVEAGGRVVVRFHDGVLFGSLDQTARSLSP